MSHVMLSVQNATGCLLGFLASLVDYGPIAGVPAALRRRGPGAAIVEARRREPNMRDEIFPWRDLDNREQPCEATVKRIFWCSRRVFPRPCSTWPPRPHTTHPQRVTTRLLTSDGHMALELSTASICVVSSFDSKKDVTQQRSKVRSILLFASSRPCPVRSWPKTGDTAG